MGTGVPPTLKPSAAPEAPTSASAWRKPTTAELVTLPSGNVARLGKPQILTMVKNGQIPNPLAAAAMNLLDGASDEQDLAVNVQVVELLVAAAFHEPDVILEGEPTAGQLHIDDIDDLDKGYVLGRILGRALVLEPFRDGGSGGDGGGDGEGVGHEAERASRDL